MVCCILIIEKRSNIVSTLVKKFLRVLFLPMPVELESCKQRRSTFLTLKLRSVTLMVSVSRWILNCMISLMMTSSFLYKIWNVLLTATPLIIEAGKTKSHSAIKQQRFISINVTYYRTRISCSYFCDHHCTRKLHLKCVLF